MSVNSIIHEINCVSFGFRIESSRSPSVCSLPTKRLQSHSLIYSSSFPRSHFFKTTSLLWDWFYYLPGTSALNPLLIISNAKGELLFQNVHYHLFLHSFWNFTSSPSGLKIISLPDLSMPWCDTAMPALLRNGFISSHLLAVVRHVTRIIFDPLT